MDDLTAGQNLPSTDDALPTKAPSSLAVLARHQITLQKALKTYVWPQTGQSLAELHLSCISILETNSPCSLQAAAHCMREILEKLQELINKTYNAPEEPPSLGSLVQQVQRKWQSLLQNMNWQDRAWKEKVIDGAMAGFLSEFNTFSAKVEATRPSRRNQKANLFKHFSASPRRVPDNVLNLIIKQWDEYEDYFTAMSHNRKPLDEGKFRDHLDHCERFILDVIEPRTFEELDEIDALIKEGESQ